MHVQKTCFLWTGRLSEQVRYSTATWTSALLDSSEVLQVSAAAAAAAAAVGGRICLFS